MKKLITTLTAMTLLFALTGCEAAMQAPGNREAAHKRCVEAEGKWQETAASWRCVS